MPCVVSGIDREGVAVVWWTLRLEPGQLPEALRRAGLHPGVVRVVIDVALPDHG